MLRLNRVQLPPIPLAKGEEMTISDLERLEKEFDGLGQSFFLPLCPPGLQIELDRLEEIERHLIGELV